jgi:AcrR family transcriptional regulator
VAARESVDNRRTDTRERVLSVALGLFARQGYAATSLREIAEQLGVTKAALYFHFRTKEEIFTAILRGYLDGITALVAAAERPLTAAAQERLLRGFATHQEEWGQDLTNLVRQNYGDVHGLPILDELRAAMQSLMDALAPQDATPQQVLRVRTALMTFQVAALGSSKDGDTEEKAMQEAALALSLEILRGSGK